MHVLMLVALCTLTQAAPPSDAGLVTRLTGKASYRGASKKETAAAAFMKLRVGDEITATAGAELRIVYFASGREETWKGPATVRVGEKQGSAVKGAAPVVRMLDAGTASGLRRVPTLVREAAATRAGATVMRGAGPDSTFKLTEDEQAELAAARAAYEAARKKAPEDDIVPDLAFLTVLRDFLQFDEMSTVLTSARKRAPASPELAALEEWLGKQQTKP